MITVNSLSGGRTSSYMAVHYPADFNVFALVRIEDPKCSPKDKGIIQKVSDKIGQEFIATMEDDLTLYAMFDLEQLIGREIVWVTGKTFDRTVNRRKYLPNINWRYCTLEMKLRPIRKWCKKHGRVNMNIGFRYDEMERVEDFVIEQDWRVVNFPMVTDRIVYPRVIKWVESTGILFPKDSNCKICYWKSLQQLRKNWDEAPQKMAWGARQETKGRRFKKDMTLQQIKDNVGLQTDFFFGESAGCQAGFCTD